MRLSCCRILRVELQKGVDAIEQVDQILRLGRLALSPALSLACHEPPAPRC